MHRDQLVEHFRQQLEIERVGAVGLGLRGIVVHLEEDAVHARGHRRARQQRDELGLAAALTQPSPLRCAAEGSCTECVASKTTGANSRMMASERMSTTRLL